MMCEGHGDTVDLEGDVGTVGRFYSDGSNPAEAAADRMRLDLKGVVYKARPLGPEPEP